MVMAQEGTFAYTFNVTDRIESGVRMVGLASPPVTDGHTRLVGYAPVLEVTEYQREPWQLYARITLNASDRRNATVRSATFSVDRGLVRVLRPGDRLHISRTSCAGIGLSIIRDGYLVAAAGAITDVPLGADVSAHHPGDLIARAEMIFRARDAEYEMREYPIELTIGGVTRILHGGRPTMGPYEVFMRHGFLRGIPGTDESVSIERRRVCPDTAAHTSAQLLEDVRLQMEQW
jgi:hypothetical protein